MRGSDFVISAEKLTKYYVKFKALDNLTFNVREGITGFLGPNAAGKSTTIKIFLGLLKPSSGKALVLGIDPTKNPLKVKRSVGFLPENPRPYKNMSGKEFLEFIGKLRGLSSIQRKEEINKLLEKVGLKDRASDKISTYSRGMVQRLFIAQTLIGEPQLILLDEPTAGLDPIGREEVINLIREFGKTGKSFFISSHILSEVEKACDQILIIDRGQLILQGNVRQIKEEFASGRYKIRVDKPEIFLKEILQQDYIKDGWVEDEMIFAIPSNEREFRKGVLELSSRLNCDLFSLEKEVPSLQEIFVSLIRKKGGVIR